MYSHRMGDTMSDMEEKVFGQQEPSVMVVPAYQNTSGKAAIDLYELAGVKLDPWEELVLNHSLGERVDGTWAAFEVGLIVGRQNGKGEILIARILAGLFLFGEKLVIYSAHEFKTSREMFRRMEDIIKESPTLMSKVDRFRHTPAELGIELITGERCMFVTRTGGSGRGFTADLVILDEAYNLDSDAMSALIPTLSSRPNPQIWYASSAGMASSSQLGRVHSRGWRISGASCDPNDYNFPARTTGHHGRLAYFEWCAGDNADLDRDDHENWLMANPSIGYRMTLNGISAERDALDDEDFARERLGIGQWPLGEAGWEVVDERTWRDLGDAESQIDDERGIAYAVDVSIDGRFGCIAAAGRRRDGFMHVEVARHKPGSNWLLGELLKMVAKNPPVAIVIDPSSPAGAILPGLEEMAPEFKRVFDIDLLDLVLRPTAPSIASACGSFVQMSRDPASLRHLNQYPLDKALRGAKKRPIGDGAWGWGRLRSTVDLSPLVAATNAAWGWQQRGTQPAMVPFMLYAEEVQ